MPHLHFLFVGFIFVKKTRQKNKTKPPKKRKNALVYNSGEKGWSSCSIDNRLDGSMNAGKTIFV
jgi:hypothetical protein